MCWIEDVRISAENRVTQTEAAANRGCLFQFLIVSEPSVGICVWRVYVHKGGDEAEVVKFSSLPPEFTAQAPTLAKCTHPTPQHMLSNKHETGETHTSGFDQFHTKISNNMYGSRNHRR